MNICERVMAESDGRITDVCIHLYYKLFDIKLLTPKITIMKKRLLSALLFVSLSFFTVNAQDYWLNEDFSSQEWQDAIRAWIDETGVGTFPEATPSNIDIPDGTEINGFTLNGAYIRPGAAELEQTCSDGDTHQYGLRLRNKGDSYIQLPQIDNAKKILKNMMLLHLHGICLKRFLFSALMIIRIRTKYWKSIWIKRLRLHFGFSEGGISLLLSIR